MYSIIKSDERLTTDIISDNQFYEYDSLLDTDIAKILSENRMLDDSEYTRFNSLIKKILSSNNIIKDKRDIIEKKLISELTDCMKLRKKLNIIIDLSQDNNKLCLNIKFNEFKNSSLNKQLDKLEKIGKKRTIEVNIYVNIEFYPQLPPIIKYIYPRMKLNIFSKLNNLNMVNIKYWN